MMIIWKKFHLFPLWLQALFSFLLCRQTSNLDIDDGDHGDDGNDGNDGDDGNSDGDDGDDGDDRNGCHSYDVIGDEDQTDICFSYNIR